jgi:protoporphyrinogen oxidase
VQSGSCGEAGRLGYNMRPGGGVGAPQVLIVGGGLAGVSAAGALRQAGCGVRLIEREARAGGRAAGAEHEGFRLDAAPFLVSSRDQRLLALIAAADLTERMLPLRPVALAHARGGSLDPAPPAGRRLEVARIGGVRLREALRLHRLARLERRFADLLDPEAPERATRLDDRSAADFVRLYFGAGVLERWAEPILGSDLLADAAETSRVAFLLARRARGEAPPATLRGSPAAVADALLSDADALGIEARALERSGDELVLDTTAGPRRADAVVLALPAAETLRVASPALAPAEREGLAPLRSVAAIVMHVALDRAPTRKATRVRVPRVEGLPLATVAVEPGGRDAPAPADAALVSLVATPVWSAAHLQADDTVIEKELLGALGRVLPGGSTAIRFREIRRYSSALPHFDVGRYRALARLRGLAAEQRAQGRRLYFAGDHWLAPTLEGAVASGHRAARELCADFGLPPSR